MAPTSVAKDLARYKRVQFSSVDTIHTFVEKSTSPLPATGKPMSQGVEMEKPKTYEYQYFKKLKLSSNQKIPCLRSSELGNEIQKRELHKHHSGMCNDYGTIFHYKRHKLQKLAEKALLLERGDLVLFGSKTIVMLLQRLEILSNSNVRTASQKKVLETPGIPIGIEKRALQSNFQPEIYSFLNTTYGIDNVCIPLDISSDAQELKHVSHPCKFSGIKTSVFQDADYLSLISPSKVNEVHQGGSDGYGWSHNGITEFDFVRDSVSNGQRLAQGIGFNADNILDTRYIHYPYSLFSKSCSFDNDNKWISKDLPSFLDLQANRCHVFESLCTEMTNLGPIRRDIMKYKPKNSPFMKDATMQLLDDEDEFKYHRQEFRPEMGMILWTSPKKNLEWTSPNKNLDFDLPLDHKDKHKHYKKEFIPETGLILWGSPNKDVFFNLKCDKDDDFYLQASSQTFSPTISLWNNDQVTGPDLGFRFSSIEPYYGTDNWEPRESLSYLLSREMDLIEAQHKLDGNTHDFPYMNVNEQYRFMQADGQEVPGFYNSPYNSRDRKIFPVKLNWGLENALSIPDIDLFRERRCESSTLSIYSENIEMMQ